MRPIVRPRCHRRWVSAVAVLTCATVLAACGSGGSSKSSKGSKSTSSTLYVGYTTIPANIDQDTLLVGGETTTAFTSTLVRYKPLPAGATKIQSASDIECYLCTDYTANPNGSYTFTLRKAESPYGHTLTSDDVLYSFQRMVGLTGSPMKFFLGFGNVNLTNPVTVISPTQFTLNVTAPSAATLGVLTVVGAGILDSTEVKSHATSSDTWAGSWLQTHSATYAAYNVTSFTPSQRVTLDQNPNYWDVKGLGYKSIVIQAVADASQRLQLLLKNTVNYIDNLNPSQLPSLKGNSAVTTVPVPSNQAQVLYLNFKYGPFAKTDVRKAIALAIDTDAIAKTVYGGAATAAHAAVPPSELPSGASQPYQYNPTEAKTLLARAGYPSGFSFTLEVSPGLGTDQVPMATLIQSQLAQVGIKVNIDQVATETEYAAKVNAKSGKTANTPYESFLWQPTPVVADTATWFQYQYTTGTFQNYQNYSNPQVDKLIAAATKLPGNAPARATDVSQATELVNADVPLIVLAEPDHLRVWSSSVTGDLGGAPNLSYGAFWPDQVRPAK